MEFKIKKLNRLETYDRLEHFKKQDFDISTCCQDLIDKEPFGSHPFYIFAHTRTEDDSPGVKRMIWQPRLTKPKAQSNSMLFKAYPGTDNIKVIWMIPANELWDQFTSGKIAHSPMIMESIDNFINHREILEAPEEDDLKDETIDQIYKEISREARVQKKQTKLPS